MLKKIFKITTGIISGWLYWLAFITGGNFIRKALLKECGQGVKISPTAFFKNPKNISIGQNSFINHNSCVWAGESSSITIGNDVIFGPGVSVIASNHGMKKGALIRLQEDFDKNIVIGNDVWLAAHVVVTAGVTIGDGCVVGAGAIVTKDLPPYSICVGVPAQVIGQRS